MTRTATAIQKRAFSLQEISEETGLSVQYLRLKLGKELKAKRFGTRILVLADDYQRFLENGVAPNGNAA